MIKKRESADIVKDRILKVATELFSQYGVNSIGIRRIAEAAGINHALIIRHFGSKDRLVIEILQREISALTTTYPNPEQSSIKTMEGLRKIIMNTISNEQDTMKLIVRSELDGLSPESFIDENSERAANLIAKWIASQQKDQGLPDAKYVSLIITAALFSFVSIAPWLMTSVGLPQDDFEKRKDEIIDVVLWIIGNAIGLPADFSQSHQ